jgi:hypothetical protein
MQVCPSLWLIRFQVHNWIIWKGGTWGRGPWGQGELRFTWAIVAWSKQFLKLGYLAIKGICSAKKNGPLLKIGIYKVKWHFTRHVGDNLEFSWHLYNDNILCINPFDRKNTTSIDTTKLWSCWRNIANKWGKLEIIIIVKDLLKL